MTLPPTIYIAASLFSPFERQRNADIAARLVDEGFRVFLPQDVRTEAGDRPSADGIFARCVRGIDDADFVVGLVDGADVDSGTAWEIGYAYARGKPIVTLRTDYRAAEHGAINIMLEFSSHVVLANQPRARAADAVEGLVTALGRLARAGGASRTPG